MYFLIFVSKHWPSDVCRSHNRIVFKYLAASYLFGYICGTWQPPNDSKQSICPQNTPAWRGHFSLPWHHSTDFHAALSFRGLSSPMLRSTAFRSSPTLASQQASRYPNRQHLQET